jgi:hypothetical protein
VRHRITKATANRMAEIVLGHARCEYPNKLDYVLTGPVDLRGPRALHPNAEWRPGGTPYLCKRRAQRLGGYRTFALVPLRWKGSLVRADLHCSFATHRPGLQDLFRRTGAMARRIVNRASKLPVKCPTYSILVLNRRLASALGFDLPAHYLVRVDEVVD